MVRTLNGGMSRVCKGPFSIMTRRYGLLRVTERSLNKVGGPRSDESSRACLICS